MRLDGEDFLIACREHSHAVCAEAAVKILLDLAVRALVVSGNVDLRPLDRALLDEAAPGGIRERAVVVALEQARAAHGRRLAVLVELLKCRLIDGERRDAGVLRLLEHLVLGEPLTLGEFLQALVVDGEVDARVLLLHFMALYIDAERREETDRDDGDEHAAVSENLHLFPCPLPSSRSGCVMNRSKARARPPCARRRTPPG